MRAGFEAVTQPSPCGLRYSYQIYSPTYIQVHLKKFEYHEKVHYFLSVISESEGQTLYRFITHRVKYFKPLFLAILMIMAYR